MEKILAEEDEGNYVELNTQRLFPGQTKNEFKPETIFDGK
jgi:hypothetical protein